ncbi:EEF1A2-binding protein 1 [Triplophysa tibetana]|uniref:EEF1A2-binding protein 1 n=1 Tax=Triplophysa tibetana TaxID=1572043 RepID=A0A5A9NUE0_9TELE|nr:EEF1A2-binding protein 1 [Triplophysa tibetana]
MKFRKSKDVEPTAPGQVAIKKRSKVPGVMITQFVEEIPAGKSHPDFIRKPIAITIQEGKLACFKSIINGDPTPTVTWARNNGDVSDPERYVVSYNQASGEHQLQMSNVGVDQADTYKCYAENEFGRAVVTVTLNIIEVGFKKSKALQEGRLEKAATDLKKSLRTRAETQKKERADGEVDEKFWELLLSADKKDYERICIEYGVTDFRGMLRKLNEKKREIEEQRAQFVEHLSNLKHIEVKTPGCAEFEFEMDLKDPNARIFLFKDGVMVPFNTATDEKHFLRQVGRKFVFSVNGLSPEDAGMYQVDVEGVNVFSTDFKIPAVDFLVKIQEVKAIEREDAVFECVLSAPLSKITWMGKSTPLVQGDKYDISVSEDMLIHRLVVMDCMQVDKGIYAAVAGIKSCNAWLIVEPDPDPNNRGKKSVRKTTMAGGGGADVLKIAAEQQEKLQKEREERMEQIKEIQAELSQQAKAIETEVKEEEEVPAGSPEVHKGSTRDEPKPKPKPEKKLDSEGVDEPEPEPEPETKVQKKKEHVTSSEQVQPPPEEESTVEEPKKRVRTGPLVPETVIDPGVHFTSGLSDVRAIIGQSAVMECKLSREDCEGAWYKDGKDITDTDDLKIIKDGLVRKLILTNCKEDDNGKYRFEADGRKTEAILIVEDPPRLNQDDLAKFSEPVIIKANQNATFKLEFIGREPIKVQWYTEGEELIEDNHVRIEKSSSHSRLLLVKCQRKDSGEIKLKLKNEFGTIEALTKLIVLDKPTNPMGPIEVLEASSDCVEFKWRSPKDDGGSPILNYNLDRNQIGRNTWMKLGNIPPEAHYKDNDVDHGRKYCYRIRAITAEGSSGVFETDDIQAGTKAYPGPPSTPKVVNAFKDHITLSWTPPTNTGGTNIVGYNMEKRKRGSNLWGQVNAPEEPIKGKQYEVKDVVEGMEYEFRVSAINFSGAGEPSTPSEFVIARDPKMRPKFTDRKMKSFMVVRAENSARININFEASPMPTIIWLKDGTPVSKRVTVSNTDGLSQLLILSAERSDSGIYTIIVKNIVGQETFSSEIRVTDDPKPPGPVELDENVPGTLTVSWDASPDEKRDDHLHYMVMKRDSVKRTWHTVADHLFNNNFTAVNIMPGREYKFRVYAKNDIGISEPSESQTWGIVRKKEKFILNLAPSKTCSFESAPMFTVPLKKHASPEQYDCYMSCAVRANPTPRVTWYRNNISINANSNYYITNTCGVCSMLILRVGPKDNGEYKVVAENASGRAESTAQLTIFGSY